MKTLITLCVLFLIAESTFGQSNTPCASGSIIAPALTVGATCSYQAGTTVGATSQTNAANGSVPSCGSMGPDAWYSFIAPASGSVSIQTTSGTISDAVMALYSGSCGSFTQLACSDDVNGLMPAISQGGLTPGTTYLIRIWQYGGGTGTFNICISAAAPPAGNTTCAVPNPICSGSPIAFTANSGGSSASVMNPGNNYSCLFSSPNPSWYYLEIATPGNLVIDISAGSDIDYSIWGPFSTLGSAVASCNTYGTPQDCSYSGSNIEQAIVPSVIAGQVYVLLVTNFANVTQTININQASANTATTNCGIVPLPVGFTAWDVHYAANTVRITWTTESETASDYFAVQRSVDGLVWETIQVLAGQGTSSTSNSYVAVDNQPKNGINYYRLMQVDLNGKQTFTSTLVANTTELKTLTVFPNPAKNELFIGDGTSEFEHIIITDMIGKSVPLMFTTAQHGVNANCSEIENGLYTLTAITSQGETLSKRVVINH
jgi:hypothetical protein